METMECRYGVHRQCDAYETCECECHRENPDEPGESYEV